MVLAHGTEFRQRGSQSQQSAGPGRKAPDDRVAVFKGAEQIGLGPKRQIRTDLRQPAHAPDGPTAQGRVFQIAVGAAVILVDVGQEVVVVFGCDEGACGHDLGHGLGRAPADAPGFVIEAPDEAAHDHARLFRSRVRQGRDNDPEPRDRMPADQRRRVAQGRKERRHGLLPEVREIAKPRLPAIAGQEVQDPAFYFPAARHAYSVAASASTLATMALPTCRPSSLHSASLA